MPEPLAFPSAQAAPALGQLDCTLEQAGASAKNCRATDSDTAEAAHTLVGLLANNAEGSEQLDSVPAMPSEQPSRREVHASLLPERPPLPFPPPCIACLPSSQLPPLTPCCLLSCTQVECHALPRAVGSWGPALRVGVLDGDAFSLGGAESALTKRQRVH